ncbi:MAG: glycosyltransferase family 39 protein [Deltaproteobacteria bacterium]|nr:glycosyltransferase family 39 protein [Deltaproteobacteria bacterium]
MTPQSSTQGEPDSLPLANGTGGAGSAAQRYGAAVIFLLATLVYRGFRSNHHYFDSIHYARLAESGDNVFWQKHILQHALVRWLWLGHGEVSVGTSALTVAQWTNALAGAGTVTLVFLCLRRFCRASLAAAAALLLGLTGVVARHAIEGEVHILPLLLLALALWLLVRHEPTPGTAVWIGLASAGAILMHQAYAACVPGVLAYLVASGARRRTLGIALAALATPVAGIYGIVFALTGLPWAELPRWVLHESGLAGWNAELPRLTGEAILYALSPSGLHYPPLRFDSIVAAFVMALLIVGAVRARTARTTPLLVFCGVTAGVGIPAITWHYPAFQYFCPIVLAIVVAAGLGLPTLPRRLAAPLAWSLVTFYAGFSTVMVLGPNHDATTNDGLSRARFIAEVASSRDVVLSTGTGVATHDLHYLPYFGNTRSVTLWEARTRHGDAQLWPGFLALTDEARIDGEGRLLVFGEMVTPGKTFIGFLETPLPFGGDYMRAALARDYHLVEIARYQGRDYQEPLYELRPRARPEPAEGRPCGLGCPFRYQCLASSCRCGPQPHFQLREDRCLPSCGALMDRQATPPKATACCAEPCAAHATIAESEWETWDCAYCCGGPAGQELCGGARK